MSDASKALQLAREIFECEERLQKLKAEHEQLFSDVTPKTVSVPQRAAFRGASVPAQIISFMQSHPTSIMTIEVIANGSGLDRMEVGRTMSRLKQTNRVVSTGRGEYSLPRTAAQEETPA